MKTKLREYSVFDMKRYNFAKVVNCEDVRQKKKKERKKVREKKRYNLGVRKVKVASEHCECEGEVI